VNKAGRKGTLKLFVTDEAFASARLFLPGQRNDKTETSRKSPFRLRVSRTDFEAVLHGMFGKACYAS
jgi:hypothetical protein